MFVNILFLIMKNFHVFKKNSGYKLPLSTFQPITEVIVVVS